MAEATATNTEKITCQLCGDAIHAVQLHLQEKHDDWTLEQYRETYPDAPLLSDLAQQRLEQKRKKRQEAQAEPAHHAATAKVEPLPGGETHGNLHEVFELGNKDHAMNAKGEPIKITVKGRGDHQEMVPNVDENYVYDPELLKSVLLGLELNIPTYLWGHAGTGKTTLAEQVAARTNRPVIRVQHTANTEEAHVVGQMLANEEGTYFEPGPLAMAMRNGWLYLPDEYDFAHPSVLAVYQPVLEGNPLIIKEAPQEWRVVEPHPDFRFVATGNTNGSGDETGLYIGTQLGNAANYSRFGITEKVNYMAKEQERKILQGQTGLTKGDAKALVEFATKVRESFEAGDVTMTIGPRELIYAGMIGMRRGSMTTGVKQAFINRASQIDQETMTGIAQRVLG